MKFLVIFTTALFMSACTSHDIKNEPRKTVQPRECLNYHSMRSAPMPPDVVERLEKACIKAQKNI